MKNKYLFILSFFLLASLMACKKYGYQFEDGYDDSSNNQGTDTLSSGVLDVDRSLYASARVWPGLVGNAEPRVSEQQFTLDLNFSSQTDQTLRIRVAPRALISTGYYAAPGELIKLVVPEGIEGLIVQIGGHTGDRTGFYKHTRDALVSMRQNLKSGVNYVRNLYGGTIYIEAVIAYPNPVTFSISGAVVSPDFILNSSNNAEWAARIRKTSVPWLELRSPDVIFLVPTKWCVGLLAANPTLDAESALRRWGTIMAKYYNSWLGLSANSPDLRDRSPQGPWRAILDVDFDAGGVAGYPFTANAGDLGGMSYINGWFQSWINTDKINPAAAFGSLHELGHNVQQIKCWDWGEGANGGLTEVTNNLHAYLYAKDTNFPFDKVHPSAVLGNATALAYVKKAANDPTKIFETALQSQDKVWMFIQLLEKMDWGLWTYIQTEGRHAVRLPASLQDKYDFFFEKACAYKQINLVDYFNAWNIPVSQVSKNAVAAKGWPRLTKKIWLYDPIKKTGGDEPNP